MSEENQNQQPIQASEQATSSEEKIIFAQIAI